jgi:Fe2+ or Zn2+ uptake regulation protein
MSSHATDAHDPRKALETGGWRPTPQRLAVHGYLSGARHHPTAEEVYRGVQAEIPNISLATVYKALETLVACGLATKLPAGDGSARYDARREQHYHFRCLRSGTVQDLPTRFDPDLIAKIDPGLTVELERNGFHVTGYRLELVGYLDDARPASPPAGQGSDE